MPALPVPAPGEPSLLALMAFPLCFMAAARTRASIAVSLFDHSNPYKRTQAQLSAGSTPAAYGPSSSSLLGPLNLHMYLDQALLPGVLAPRRPFDVSPCIEEDELEHETSSQPSLSTYGPPVLLHTGDVSLVSLCCVLVPTAWSHQAHWSHSRASPACWPRAKLSPDQSPALFITIP